MPTVNINSHEIVLKEHNQLRVVTFRDVDTVHNRPEGTARKAFNRNRSHFLLGTDYFVLKTDEAMKALNYPAPNGLILLTESGYLMLVKAFSDKLAWQVQRELVNGYFKEKSTAAQPRVPLAQPPVQPMCVDTPNNRNAQRVIEKIRNEAVTLTTILDLYSCYLSFEDAVKYKKVIGDIGASILSDCYALGRVQLKLIEQPR